jgi:hypothetical protein
LIIGNPSIIGIESSITRAYERLSFRALGFFVIHVGGRCYGVKSPDATLLANSFDEVERRVAMRGSHAVPFATEADAGKIADSFRNAIYADRQQESYFDIPRSEFSQMIHSRNIMWALDGDEAFDDAFSKKLTNLKADCACTLHTTILCGYTHPYVTSAMAGVTDEDKAAMRPRSRPPILLFGDLLSSDSRLHQGTSVYS